MIRRILVFLAIIFVSFFAYRQYDRVAADLLLSKVKNFSLKGKTTYTTTITNSDGTTLDWDSSTIGSSWFIELINDTLSDKSSLEDDNKELIEKILTSDTIKNNVQQPVVDISTLTGETTANTWNIQTIIVVPTQVQSTPPRVVRPVQEPVSPQLSQEDKSELEKFIDMFQ